jgi:hypothetical protein
MIGSNGRAFADCGHEWVARPAWMPGTFGESISSCEVVEELRVKGARANGLKLKPRRATHDAVKTKSSKSSENVTRAPALGTGSARNSEGA